MKYLVVYKQYKTKFNIALFLGLSSFDSYHPGKWNTISAYNENNDL